MVITARSNRELSHVGEWFLVVPTGQQALPCSFIKRTEIRHSHMVTCRDSGIKADALKELPYGTTGETEFIEDEGDKSPQRNSKGYSVQR